MTLERDRTDFRVPAPKVPQKLPEILSREEVWRLIDASRSPNHRLLLATTYAAGLRVSEVVTLKVSDIDPERLTIRVAQGKGGKDRDVALADRLFVELRRYWQVVPPAHWVFPNRQGTRPIGISVPQKIYLITKSRSWPCPPRSSSAAFCSTSSPSASSAFGTSPSSPTAPALLLRLTGIDIERCQVWGQGRLASVQVLRPTRPIPVRAPDTS